MPISILRKKCTEYRGGWVEFRTPFGVHRGVVERVTNNAVLMRVPRQYAPVTLAAAQMDQETDENKKLDVALAAWGYGFKGPGWGGYGSGYGMYGPGWGWWGAGWWWWWLAFAWIFALAFLWW